MSNIEDRLHSILDESVSEAHVSHDLITAVRARHRRRRTAAAAWTAIAVAGILSAVTLALLPSVADPKPAVTVAPSAPLFPGGGRLLFLNKERLYWQYADGRVQDIASGFVGATITDGQLLAWKSDKGYRSSYTTMRLDGSGSQLALPAETDARFDDSVVSLSPDGSQLAFIRRDLTAAPGVPDQLWISEVSTGTRRHLGTAFANSMWWQDATTLLVTSADHRSLESVNVNTGTRTTVLSVADPRVAGEYRKARPSSGAPTFIQADGWAPGRSHRELAILVAGSDANGVTQPAEIIVAGTQMTTFAPPPVQQWTFTWGVGGSFVLGVGSPHRVWDTYYGKVQLSQVLATIPFGESGAFVSPDGTTVALQDREILSFASASCAPPACDLPVKQLTNAGDLLGWDR